MAIESATTMTQFSHRDIWATVAPALVIESR